MGASPPDHPSTPRIAFAGTPGFAVPALEAMIRHQYAPVAVLTQPDRPAGRGRSLQASPVKQCAEGHGIKVLQPATLSDEAIVKKLESVQIDLMVVVAYGLILPVNVLRIPRYGCWNIHASLLPRWRGAAPIQRAIEAGDDSSGVSIMQMAAGLDTGPVFLQSETDLDDGETGGSLHDCLSNMGADALLECLNLLCQGNMPEPVAQDERKATYASKLDKSEAEIKWDSDARLIERRVRAFNPWPVCWCVINGQRLRIWNAKALDLHDKAKAETLPGTVIAASPGGIDIAARGGMLRLLEVQKAGGRRMSCGEYLNANPVPVQR